MKLTSTLVNKETQEEKTTVIAKNCTVAQAMTMIESWCVDNGADMPILSNIYKNTPHRLCVDVFTNDYHNMLEITD
jgi:hypothetical protein